MGEFKMNLMEKYTQIAKVKQQGEFDRLFHQHMQRVKLLPGPDAVKERNPEVWAVIQAEVKAMDSAWYQGDLPAFKTIMNKLERLYVDETAKY